MTISWVLCHTCAGLKLNLTCINVLSNTTLRTVCWHACSITLGPCSCSGIRWLHHFLQLCLQWYVILLVLLPCICFNRRVCSLLAEEQSYSSTRVKGNTLVAQ